MPSTIVSPSPIIRTNNDVLREIFIQFTFQGVRDDKSCHPMLSSSTCFVIDTYRHSTLYPQFSVSQVCSSWRDVALHTPQLWSDVQICWITKGKLSVAARYLSRAGNYPVSIEISGKLELDEHPPLVDFLSSYRLRNLSLHSHALHLDFILAHLPQRSVADLVSLRQVYESPHSVLPWHSKKKAFIDLNDPRYPKLTFIRLWGAYTISGGPSSLRIFDGTYLPITVIECLGILSCCPLLEEARLRITGIHELGYRPEALLQHLRFLFVYLASNFDALAFHNFIEALSLPAIEEWWLNGRIVEWPMNAFESLAHRSSYFPHFRKLYLDYSDSIIDAGTLLGLIPSIKNICLACSEFTFDDLTLNRLVNGSLAPQLKNLRIGRLSNSGPFLDMVESRMENARRSENGIPVLFKSVSYSTFDLGLRNWSLDKKWQRIPDQRRSPVHPTL